MIDPNYIRENTEYVKKIISSGRSKPNKADVNKWLILDKTRSELIQRIDLRREQRNEYSKGITGKPDPKIIEQVKQLKSEIEALEIELKPVEQEWQAILDWIPNIPISEDAMPFGDDEPDNPIDKFWTPQEGYIFEEKAGTQKYTVGTFDKSLVPERSAHWDEKLINPEHHVEIGTRLKMFDLEQGAKVSGTRFKYLTNDGALLEHALFMFISEKLRAEGFIPTIPPLFVKERSLYGTSHFPEGRDQVYNLEVDERIEDPEHKLYIVGSSEPSNFSLFMDKIIPEVESPQIVFSYTPCFRSEVGSWGKDVRGIKRVHQFAKVEMNAVCTKEQSTEIFAKFLSINEWLLQQLEIPYRLARKCTGDAGYHASAEQIDPEVWLPGQKEWMEVGTDTNTTDFQARRLNIKIQRKDGSKEFAHTVNDTGLAVERTIISIIDHYQQSNGTIKVPKVLQKYMGKDVIGAER